MHREKETFGRAGTLDSTLGRFQTRRQATHKKCFALFFYDIPSNVFRASFFILPPSGKLAVRLKLLEKKSETFGRLKNKKA
jgi:hypothetical protein